MGIFDGMAEQHFAKEDQVTVFYPWSWYWIYRGGRLIDNAEQEQSIRKFVKNFRTIEFIAILASIVVGVILGMRNIEFREPYHRFGSVIGLSISFLIVQCVSIPLWIYCLRLYRVNELKIFTKKSSLFQSIFNAASAYGTSTLSLMVVLNLLMLIADATILWHGLTSRTFDWVDVSIGVLGLGFFGFTFYLWIYMLSNAKRRDD